MRRQLTSFTIMMTAGVLALAACSQGGGQQSGNTANEEAPMGPLDKYLSVLWEGQDYTQEHYDKIDLQREELMAECMAKEGFEYVPNANSGTTVMSDDDQEGPAWDSLEFAQQYGYGVFDWPGSSGDDEAPVDEEIYVDPNEGYVNSLSPSEQEAYYATLYGEPQFEEVDGAMRRSTSTTGKITAATAGLTTSSLRTTRRWACGRTRSLPTSSML